MKEARNSFFTKEKLTELKNNNPYYEDIIINKMSDSELEKSERELIKEVINDICKQEDLDITDLKYIDIGSMTLVYKLGDKAIKIGDLRDKYDIPFEIPNHERILQPIFRKKFKNLQVEITDYLKEVDITNEDVFYIYQQLRDAGIIWADPRCENVRKLENKTVNNYNYEIEGMKKLEENNLSEADLVIIDNDLIFKEENFDKTKLNKNIDINPYENMERRYQYEKKEMERFLK